MHICFSTIDYHQKGQGGGIASYLDALTPALVQMGHQVSIVGPGTEASDAVNAAGVRVILQPLGSWAWYAYKLKLPSWFHLLLREWQWSRSLARALRRLHQRQPIDIIESHEVGLWQLVRQKRHLPPVVVRLHGSPYIFSRYSGRCPSRGERLLHRLELGWLKQVAGITAPGQFQADWYQKELGQTVAAIPNPLAGQFKAALEQRPQPVHTPLILYTGRIEYRKGSLVLIEAFGRLLKTWPAARLVIAGARHNSISEGDWQAALQKAGVQNNLEQLGHVAFADLQKQYARATVFVMPSYYETFGISVLEAMAHGLPVVATQAGALPELVQDGTNGYTIAAGDAEALAQALAQVLAQPEQARKMGRIGQIRVAKEFTAPVVAEQLVQFYQKAVSL